MVWGIIIEGMLDMFGSELLVGFLLLFCFLIMAFSRGAGFVSLGITTILTIYLFSEDKVANNAYLFTNEIAITLIIIMGLILGWVIAFTFLRD